MAQSNLWWVGGSCWMSCMVACFIASLRCSVATQLNSNPSAPQPTWKFRWKCWQEGKATWEFSGNLTPIVNFNGFKAATDFDGNCHSVGATPVPTDICNPSSTGLLDSWPSKPKPIEGLTPGKMYAVPIPSFDMNISAAFRGPRLHPLSAV